nr:ribonuclease H-like domain-containing protein [Tanacetum cinerariifolium]
GGPEWLFDIDALSKSMNYAPVPAGIHSNDFAGKGASFDADSDGHNKNKHGPSQASKSDNQDRPNAKSSTKIVDTARPVNIATPTYADYHSDPLMPDLGDTKIVDDAYDDRDEGAEMEPKKVTQALDDESWVESMQEELLPFKLLNVWTLVDLLLGKRAIGTKWVYRNKKDQRGNVTAYQLSNIFTKALVRERFEFLVKRVGMQSITLEELKLLAELDEDEDQYKDAKTLFEVIQARFGDNDATKKTQKTLLKQMYENFNALSTESLDSIHALKNCLFAPPTIDLSNSGLEEFQHPEFIGYRPKDSKSVCVDTSNEIKKASDAPIIKDWVSDSNEDDSEEMDDLQDALKDQGYFDNGCSKHMTRNISYLTNFKEHDGGYVAFGRGAKGGKITRKGTFRTGKLDFEDVYLIKELQYNLFSVSHMCDIKNSVLFTDTECFVLSPNFKLADESQVLLKVSRKNNMYNFDMKNIVPQKQQHEYSTQKVNFSKLYIEIFLRDVFTQNGQLANSFLKHAFSSVVTGPGIVEVEVPSAFAVDRGLKLKGYLINDRYANLVQHALSSRLKALLLTMVRSLRRDVGISSEIDPRVPT